MELGTVSGIATVLLMVAFVSVVIWAYSSKRKPDFDAAARLPLADKDETSATDENKP